MTIQCFTLRPHEPIFASLTRAYFKGLTDFINQTVGAPWMSKELCTGTHDKQWTLSPGRARARCKWRDLRHTRCKHGRYTIQLQLYFVRNKYEPPRPPPRPICHSLPTLLTHSPTLLPCLKIAAKRGSVFCVAEGNRKHQETQTGGNNLHFKGEFAIEKLNYFRKMFWVAPRPAPQIEPN